MARPPAKELTDRELQVMQVFWQHGEATATAARDRLAAVRLDLAYVTVANLTRILLDKGFLELTNEERPIAIAPPRRSTKFRTTWSATCYGASSKARASSCC